MTVTADNQGLASRIGRMIEQVALLDTEDLPRDAVVRYGQTVADCYAVAYAGYETPEMRKLTPALLGADPGGDVPMSGRSSAWSRVGQAGSPSEIAWLNATAGSFLELDEGTRPRGHAGMHVVPAVLAYGEGLGCSGKDAFRSVVVGYEVAARLLGAFSLVGTVHPHGHLASGGAAVGCALLSGADPVRAAEIALSLPLASLWESCFDGATARNTYMAHAARLGVISADMSNAGFTGSTEAIETVFNGLLARSDGANELLEAPLDVTDLRIMHSYTKWHSACALAHASIDAAIQVRPGEGAVIHEVVVETVINNLKLARLPAQNSLSARFSIPYAVAAALLSGKADIDSFDYDEAVYNLATKVRVQGDEELDRMWPIHWPARVTVRSSDGVQSAEVLDGKGSGSSPLTEAERRKKFEMLVDVEHHHMWEYLTNLHDDDTPFGCIPSVASTDWGLN